MVVFFHAQDWDPYHAAYSPVAAQENSPTTSRLRGWGSPTSCPCLAGPSEAAAVTGTGAEATNTVFKHTCYSRSVPCTSDICTELLPLSSLKLSTFYFKMTLQVLVCDTHFNGTLILHNSHMIQCVCFMRQTWHVKIKNMFLVWNTERNCRGKKKKQWERMPRDQGGGKKGGKNRMQHQSHFILPRVKTAFISMKDN